MGKNTWRRNTKKDIVKTDVMKQLRKTKFPRSPTRKGGERSVEVNSYKVVKREAEKNFMPKNMYISLKINQNYEEEKHNNVRTCRKRIN